MQELKGRTHLLKLAHGLFGTAVIVLPIGMPTQGRLLVRTLELVGLSWLAL